jgi:hypothetical protein
MRAHLLAGEDRALLEMYLERGSSLRQISRLMGLTHQSVGRRIRRIIRGLTSDVYDICLANRDNFSGRELAVIKDFFVGGVTTKIIAQSRAVTPYRVDATLRKARRYAASVKACQTRNPNLEIRNPSVATAEKGGKA